MTSGSATLSERFLSAVSLAHELRPQARWTATGIPYLAHLLVVTGLVIGDGGDEDEAIAAMLHDALECACAPSLLDRIARNFGPRVATIVRACSYTSAVSPAETWIERKRRYLAHLVSVRDDAILRVALAVGVHTARSTVGGFRQHGSVLRDGKAQGSDRDQLWYYGGLVSLFQTRRPGPLTEDLLRLVAELTWLVARHRARSSEQLWLWVDEDLHQRQAPDGWIHVRTSDEAVALLAEFPVHVLSLPSPEAASPVLEWLIQQDAGGKDRWPADRITFHGVNGLAPALAVR